MNIVSKVFRHDLVPVLGKLGFKGEFTKKGGQVGNMKDR